MKDIKFCCSTSDNYHHLLRINIFLFNKNWSSEQGVEIVGYKKPDFDLPDNFTFVSMGEQIGGATNFGGDLRKYFEKQPDWVLWEFDDTFFKSVNFNALETMKTLMDVEKCGKINLSRATRIQNHTVFGEIDGLKILEATQTSAYRLSTQPAIWNRDYLLQYLQEGQTPWTFETQPAHNDGWRLFGAESEPVKHNEGTTKWDIYKLDLNGIPKEQIEEMEKLGILTDKMTY